MTELALVPPIAAGSAPAMRPRHGEARGRILRAYDALLGERAAEAVSADDIAAAAGLSRRTIFNQFPGLEALYRDSREALLRAVMQSLPREIGLGSGDGVAALLVGLAAAFSAPEHRSLLISLLRDRDARPWLEEAYRDWIWEPSVQRLQLHLLRDGDGSAARDEAERLVTFACALACGHCPPCAEPAAGDPGRVAAIAIAFARGWRDSGPSGRAALATSALPVHCQVQV